ncbi:MAG TPA: hypothetical protein VFB59_03720 [Candidatus Saccharimonadales bacterium]|nr:hypothetical protein [Candidatus Saccharimonadales bacterium]
MEQLRQQVIATQGTFEDLLDKPNDAVAQKLRAELRGLEDDLQVKKNPITVGDRIKHIIALLDGPAAQNQIMDYRHLTMLRQRLSTIRQALSRMG